MTKYMAGYLLLILCAFYPIHAQESFTNVARIEIDGKETKKAFKIFFRGKDDWMEAPKKHRAFSIPAELRNCRYFDISIAFGKYQLDFSQIYISKFRTDWIVGVDTKPFSDENVEPEEVDKTELAGYID